MSSLTKILNNGAVMPAIGLGTWRSDTGKVAQAVQDAIAIGYRHIDCAYIYGNEHEVGDGIKAKITDGTVKREDLFISSKVWNTFHSKEALRSNLKESLKNLGVSYLDLYLIHWPMGYQEDTELFPKNADGKFLYSDVDYLETWGEMEKCVEEGLIRSIGLSNFSKDQIQRIIDSHTLVPAVVQVECNVYMNQQKMIDYCQSKGIMVTGFAPFGSPDRPWVKPDEPLLIDNAKVKTIAEKHGKTPAQVLIRYQIQRGVIVIPKSVTKSRIESNFQVFEFELDTEDMHTLNALNRNKRSFSLEWVADHPLYPFHTES